MKIIIQDNVEYRVFPTTDEAWNALTPEMLETGWRIVCYGGYENCICHEIV